MNLSELKMVRIVAMLHMHIVTLDRQETSITAEVEIVLKCQNSYLTHFV